MKRRTFVAGGIATSLCRTAAADGGVPLPIAANLVVTSRREWQGHDCLAVELTDGEQKLRLEQAGGGNRPSFAIVEKGFTNGTLDVAIGAELTGKGAPDDRGFAGLSFHIGADFASHETVYLRMTNGRLNDPPPPAPRINRAIQYVADPGFHFDRSREEFPGRYEKGADIAVGRWHRLRLEIAGQLLRASVDGTEVLTVPDLRFPGRNGPVGLFVGDGSRGYFRDLRVLAG
ncbi:MAG: hypothetical protein JOY64_21300 [Alphaproteobacteria bacterium]|nr:hypothetical protein [Alphaproteobacteria bacterium]MBV8410179.1 hypothetical protein [Alphaproteobacteria bacterium]